MSEREQEDKLLQIFRELGKEERPKLLNVGEIMIALKNLPDKPKSVGKNGRRREQKINFSLIRVFSSLKLEKNSEISK